MARSDGQVDDSQSDCYSPCCCRHRHVAERKNHPAINMPGMSGLDLLPVAETRRPALPVFMISAYGDTGTVDMALSRGVWKLLTKPVNFAQLERDVIAVIAEVRGGR